MWIKKLFKIYVVGWADVEDYSVESYHLFYYTALKSYHRVRLRLIRRIEEMQEHDRKEGYPEDDMWSKMIKNLSETTPNKVKNFPHEAPFIDHQWVGL